VNPIASRENERFKSLRRLAQTRAERRAQAAALIEGVRLCQAYLQSGGVPRELICSQGALANQEVQALCRSWAKLRPLILSDELFASLSQLEHGIGVACVIERPSERDVALTGDAILLDRLQDPGNLGAILRSAAAAGIVHVFCARGTVESWSPKVLRAGMGAHFLLRIHEDVDLGQLVAVSPVELRATSAGAPRTLYGTDLKPPAAWLFGNEGQGIEAPLMARCKVLSIPQPGAIESLNVAAAAAICLFEQLRQRAYA
jgi:RNA methyltransferase, TrmH family